MNYTEGETFENLKNEPLPKGDYENCHFINCDFSGANLSDFAFVDCMFTGCNLSLAKLNKTAFREVRFKDCKMLGLHFEHCNGFGLAFRFEHCILNDSSFYQTKIKQTHFRSCQMLAVDFTETDIAESIFDHCDLQHTTFDRTILEKADLRTAFNYQINPETNRIKKAKFSLPEVVGLLAKYDISITR